MLLFSQTSTVTPDFFFQVFAKISLTKNIFEEEKKLKKKKNLHFFNVHIMNVNYAKFPKKFDSRTISRELP